MKNIRLALLVALVASLATFTVRADSFDSDTATIQKASDKTAKVLVDKGTYTVPISFADGASWDNVEDHYELSDGAVALIKAGKASLSIGTDGSVSTSKKK